MINTIFQLPLAILLTLGISHASMALRSLNRKIFHFQLPLAIIVRDSA